MRYIDVLPQIRNNIFFAHVVMSDYNVEDQMVIKISARRNDGVYETKVIKYPENETDTNEDIVVSFFGMSKSLLAQIVSVRINGTEIMVHSTEIEGTDITARYDDSITRMKWSESMNDIDLDFEVVGTNNPKTLRVIDQSEWGILVDRPAIIEIVTPSSDDKFTYYLGKNQINLFTSNTLGINPGERIKKDLPDGIYDITITGSPSSYTFNRKYLKTDLIHLNLDRVWARSSILCDHEDDDVISKIKEIEFVLAAAESNTRLGNIIDAKSLMERAESLMYVLNNCNNCNCNNNKK